jgi:hypothetical protein
LQPFHPAVRLGRGSPCLDEAALSHLERRQRLGEEGVHVGEVAGADLLDDLPPNDEMETDELEHRSIVLERLTAELVGGNETSLAGRIDVRAQGLRIPRGERVGLIEER